MPTITRQQLDEIVDANVTNKTAPLSLTPQQEGFAIKKVADYVDDNKQDLSQKSQDISEDADSEDKYPSTKAVVDYVSGQISSIPSGPQGEQGIEGPAGPPGPVGPAGLEWKGSWSSGFSYVEDDAVGYNGASWFCILATSGTTAPNLDPTHWALLASQGAQGIQGEQGPVGPQGPAGLSATKTFGSLEIDNVSPYQVLSFDLNSIVTTGAFDKVVLPSDANIGDIVYVFAMNNSNSFSVRGNQSGSSLISTGGIATQTSSLSVAPNTSYQFIYLGSGYWKSSEI